MKEDLIIDGCAFTETEFTGVTEDVLHSKMDAFFLTIPGEGDGYVASTRSIGKIYNMLDNPKYGLMIAKSVADIYKAKEDGKKALILAFQNPNSIENSLEQLRVFYELGVRVIQMTYNDANFIGTGCCESQDGGLTDFGKRVLKMMNRLGMWRLPMPVFITSHPAYEPKPMRKCLLSRKTAVSWEFPPGLP